MKSTLNKLIDAFVTLWFLLTPQKAFCKQARKPNGAIGRFMMTRIFLRGNDPLNRFTLDCLNPKPTDHVLDIGFGPGKWLGEIVNRVPQGKVNGIDFSEAMVRQATKTLQASIDAGRVALVHGDCRKMPYADNTFDKVFSVNTLYFWTDLEGYFQEICRVLRPGGRVVIGFKDKEQLLHFNLTEEVFCYYTREEVVTAIKRAGFDDAHIREREENPFSSYCAVATKVGSE